MLEWIRAACASGGSRPATRAAPSPRRAGFRGRVDVLDADGADASSRWSARPARSRVDPTAALRSTAAAASSAANACAPRPTGSRSRAGYETAARSRRRARRRRRAHDRRRASRCAATLGDAGARAATLDPRAPHRLRLRRLGGVGDPGAVEPLLRHPAARVLPDRLAAARRHPARHRRCHRSRCARRCERTWEVMPEPKALVAVGTDACSGGLQRRERLTAGGVDAVLPVDVYVPGSPPRADRDPARPAAGGRPAARAEAAA